MKKATLIMLATGIVLSAAAQTKNGGISEQMLRDIQKEQHIDNAEKALMNAIAGNSIDDLTRSHANQGQLDTYFSVETKKQSITDQKQSGRCWMFSGMNVLRADFQKRTDSLTVEFSQAYLFFWDQLEKANLML